MKYLSVFEKVSQNGIENFLSFGDWASLLDRSNDILTYSFHLKGLACEILGSISTDRILIDVTKIAHYRFKSVEKLKRNTVKPKRGMDGQK